MIARRRREREVSTARALEGRCIREVVHIDDLAHVQHRREVRRRHVVDENAKQTNLEAAGPQFSFPFRCL